MIAVIGRTDSHGYHGCAMPSASLSKRNQPWSLFDEQTEAESVTPVPV